jgi:hypothetical protein
MIDKHRKMGRIEKIKRQAINEANRRVLKEEDKEQNLWDEFKSWWDNLEIFDVDVDVDKKSNEQYAEEIIRWMEEKLSAHSSTQRKLTPEEKKDIEKILDDTHDTDGYILTSDQEEIKRRMTYQYFLDLYKVETNTDYIPIKSFKQLVDQKYGR